MKIPLLLITIACLIFIAPAYSKENCLNCHGQKNGRTYVNMDAFGQSAHGFLDCDACHANISPYPHRTVQKVKCVACHSLGTNGAPQEQAQQYTLSVHGRANYRGSALAPDCRTCHGSHYIYRSSDPRATTNKQKISALCGQCHSSERDAYEKSIHGMLLQNANNMGAPSCFDCHMEHRIPGTADKEWKLALIRKCGACHSEELNTYHKTYHGKVTELGYTTIAKCWDCHGTHTILPPSDPASTLSIGHITATCGKCHPGATKGFTKFYAHAEETNRAKYPLLYYTFLFMTVLLIGVFAFFLTHTLLWSYRALKERIQLKGEK